MPDVRQRARGAAQQVSKINLNGYQGVVKPLEKCVLRCDRHLQLLVGGTYGYTRLEKTGRKFHGGIDLFAEPGTKARALYGGTVKWVGDHGHQGWGKWILLTCPFKEGLRWALYAHLSQIYVKPGLRVSAGALLGLTGTTGNGDSRYPHLHLEIWHSLEARHKGTREKYRLDPLLVLGPIPFQPFAEEIIDQANTA